MFGYVFRKSFFVPIIWAFTALPLAAQEAPRVETKAGGAELTINEINTRNYPDVAVFATVLKDGIPVSSLRAEDFKVSEDEVEQSPLTVEAQLPPLSVVVTVDVSGSMSKRMDVTKSAAADFVGQLGGKDAVQLVSFQRDIATVTQMTTQKEGVVKAIGGLVARGDTALYDALLTSLNLAAQSNGRKAVVLLSDGVDDDGTGHPLSKATVDKALQRAAEINVPVFVIGLGTAMDEVVLKRIAAETGGRYLPAPEPSQLAEVYNSIGTQLSGQYAIRYTSSLPADGTTRRVNLRVADLLAAKSYSAPGKPGNQTAGTQTTANGECSVPVAVAKQRPMLEKAKDGYDRNLISVTQRDNLRKDVTDAVLAAAKAAPPTSLDCAKESLSLVNGLYDANLITVTQRDNLREPATEALNNLCTTDGALESLQACLVAYSEFYNNNLITVTTRDKLIKATAQPYLEALAKMDNLDEALARANSLYEMNAISVTTRDEIRNSLGQRFLMSK